MPFGETGTANQRSLEILNFARYLISELSLVVNWQGEKKSGLSRKSKVSALDIRIKRSELKVSNSKVPAQEELAFK